ncbi:RNB domain-containing ribonuclease [Microbacterium gorillae]|uniref:RNB domain-containing ribonuclease n=1 Tax=Microbacterium gorillae TaxID=1231063 RepID=UPI000693651F|nr:RNB domain-containing ribonuclease [Microbacterium gorillae]
MPMRYTRLSQSSEWIEQNLRAVREAVGVTADFPPEVTAEAESAARSVVLPDEDGTNIPFVTIDPAGSRDLDQALAIAHEGSGFVVHYAIADLPAVVPAGGAVDREARERGQTLYAPDETIPLHPRVLSEDAASLLPDVERGAYVWRMVLDASGAVTETTLRRMRVRSREQLSYVEAQERIEQGDPALVPLREVGRLRISQEAGRQGASLGLPDEEVVLRGGRWHITRRSMLPVEEWNAQISLMTGMAAARLQLDAGVGVLRTMPRPSAEDMAEFRKQSTALGVDWLPDEDYGAYLRRLPRESPVTLAILNAARRLFRGAGYVVLNGTRPDDEVTQAAIGAPYAHTTAPLRRLVDRYVLAHCEAIANGRPVPDWATAGLEGLPEIMQESGSRAGRVERESLAVVTAAVMDKRVGSEFDAIVLERRNERARVELVDPPVEADAFVRGEPGAHVRVRLTGVDLDERTVTFEAADPSQATQPAAPAKDGASGGGSDPGQK